MTSDPAGPTQPWRFGDLIILLALTMVGGLLIGAAWFGASGTTGASTQAVWLSVSVAGTATAGVGSGLWLMAGHRNVRLRQRAVAIQVGQWLTADPELAELVPEAPLTQDASLLLAGPRMMHFHRPMCHLVIGKPATALQEHQHRRAGRVPCGICRPLEGSS